MNNPAEVKLQRKRAAILFADVANYSRMMGRDEVNTTLAVRERIRLFKSMVEGFDGEIVDIAGDGLFLIFEHPESAVQFAMEIQNKLLSQNDGLEKDQKIWFRMGINVGEVLIGEDELSGDSINIASRIEAFAQPGRICISGSVYDEVKSELSYGYEYLGAQEFKNIGKSVDVFQVHEQATSAAMTTGLRTDRLQDQDYGVEPITDQSILVLPFSFQGADSSESWFADGLTEDITTNLSRFQEFFVIARGSAYVYRDKNIAPMNAGRQVGVRYVVDGSVRKIGMRVRITLQLIDTQKDRTIWGEQYNRDVEDLFDLQDEITQTIVSATAAKIQASERDRLRQIPPNSLEAYGFVLRGQNHVMRYTQADVRQARGLYNAALSSDPRYARALSAKSRTLNLEWRYNWTSEPEAALKDSFDLARIAVELDGSDARGFGELGFAHLYRKENDSALASYERATQLNPNDADLMSDMADAMAHSGRSEDAIKQLHKAMRLNPFYPDQYLWNLGGAHFNLKQYEEAARWILKMQNPTEGRRLLAASYAYLGRKAEAEEEVRKILKAHPNFDLSYWATIQPDKYPEDADHFVEGMRRAGFPSKA